jgi:hypothetical protein
MAFVYVLSNPSGYYFIGVSNNLKPDIQREWKGEGCLWNIVHKPNRIELIRMVFGKVQPELVSLFYKLKYGDHMVYADFADGILDAREHYHLIWISDA